MNHRVPLALVGAATTVLLVAGCSGNAATPPASSPPPLSAGEALPHSGAPKVAHPLPASVLAGDPCHDALTSDQLEEIFGTVPNGERDDTAALGPACNWKNSGTGALVGISYTTQVHDGLSAVYQNTKPKASLWRELRPIQGFPAVADVAVGAGAETDFCQVSVGITDQLTFDASLTLGETKIGKADPCELAGRVAGFVVTNLRQKAGS